MKDITSARAKFEKSIISVFNKMDTSGYNGEQFKQFVSNMSDNEIIELAKGYADYTFDKHLTFEDDLSNTSKHKKGYKFFFELAEKLNIPIKQRLIYTNEDGTKYAGPNEAMVFPLSIRVMQQLSDKKNNVSSDTDDMNMITGQPTGDTRASAFTNAQHRSMLATGQDITSKEFNVFRSDNENATRFMLNQIENNGSFKTNDYKHSVKDQQSLNTAHTFLLSAGIVTDMNNEIKK